MDSESVADQVQNQFTHHPNTVIWKELYIVDDKQANAIALNVDMNVRKSSYHHAGGRGCWPIYGGFARESYTYE